MLTSAFDFVKVSVERSNMNDGNSFFFELNFFNKAERERLYSVLMGLDLCFGLTGGRLEVYECPEIDGEAIMSLANLEY